MTTITISRQLGSGGNEIANRVCELLDYQRFDKRMLAQAASLAGLSDAEIIDFSEENYKVRKFLDRLFNRPAIQIQQENELSLDQEKMPIKEENSLKLVKSAILFAYHRGDVVIMGRGGQVILKDKPGALFVRIEAPMEDRIQRVKVQFRESRQISSVTLDLRRKVQDWILERDQASAEYLKRFYNVDWEDTCLYHLIINTGKLNIEESANLIAHQAQHMVYQPEVKEIIF
jgi:cytidylate kinase